MSATWYQSLFQLGRGPIPLALTARVAVAVGIPLIGFLLTGDALAGVVAGATAMFVTLSDIGTTRKERLWTMIATTLAMLAGGVLGDKLGGTPYAKEAVVIFSALLAGWVSGAHPGIAAVARFAAIATAAGAGIQITDARAVFAVLFGGAWAIAAGFAIWKLFDVPADENHMDWRAGVRRALAGADAGPRFALCYAAAASLALFTAQQLGVTNAYWATLTTIMVMRREGTVSLPLVIHYMAGTLIAIPVAYLIFHTVNVPVVIALFATAAAASARIGFALNPALGFTGFTVFLVLAVDLALQQQGAPSHLLSARLYDVAVGCGFALAGTLAASVGVRRAPVAPTR